MSASQPRTAGDDGNLPPDRDFDALAAALSRARCRKSRPDQRQLTEPVSNTYYLLPANMAEVRRRRQWVATIARRYQADGELHASAQACLDALARRAEVEP